MEYFFEKYYLNWIYINIDFDTKSMFQENSSRIIKCSLLSENPGHLIQITKLHPYVENISHGTLYVTSWGKGVVKKHISRNLIFTLPPSLRANKIMSQLVYIPPIGLQHRHRLPWQNKFSLPKYVRRFDGISWRNT